MTLHITINHDRYGYHAEVSTSPNAPESWRTHDCATEAEAKDAGDALALDVLDARGTEFQGGLGL